MASEIPGLRALVAPLDRIRLRRERLEVQVTGLLQSPPAEAEALVLRDERGEVHTRPEMADQIGLHPDGRPDVSDSRLPGEASAGRERRDQGRERWKGVNAEGCVSKRE